LEIQVLYNSKLLPKITSKIRHRVSVLLYRIKISISRCKGVHSLIEFSLEFLTKQRLACVIRLKYLLLSLILLLLKRVDFLLLPDLPLLYILRKVVVHIIDIFPLSLVNLILDEGD
jgi:hypothetical protein